MTLVKSLLIKGTADFTKAKAELDDVAARARKLGEMDPTIKPKFDSGEATLKLKAFQLELKSLKQSGNDTGLQDLAGRLKSFGDESVDAKTKMAALRLESDALKASLAGEGGNGGLVKAAEDSGSAFTALSGNAMPALIGGITLLSPAVATLGFGLGGLGLAAAGLVKPIEKAAQKTGGLKANLGSLNAEQQTVAGGILGLGKSYSAFQHDLEPTVVKDFNAALGFATPLLKDIEPVARATGSALAQTFGALGAEFSSNDWQRFFTFMAQQAGPDVKQLTTFLVNLTGALPPLLEQLQPTTTELLDMATDTAKLINLTSHLSQTIDTLGGATKSSNPAVHGLGEAFQFVSKYANPQQQLMAGINFIVSKFGNTASTTAKKMQPLPDLEQHVTSSTQQWAQQQQALNTALTRGLTPLQDYIGATLTQRNDLKNLNDALKTSGDRIGYNTQKQRDSFGAAQTYIQDLENTASKAIAAHKGIDTQITSLENSLPVLERVKGKTQDYRDELAKLRNMLAILRAEKAIGEVIHITGVGDWSLSGAPGHLLPHHRPTGNAAGYRVPGYGGGDRYPALLEGGESVVPKHLTPAVAPFLKANGVPGFAGGLVGSYSGNVPGLQPWTESNWNASITSITNSIGNALSQQFPAMLGQAFGSLSGAGLGGSASANRALAMRMFPWPGSMFPAFDYVEMREAGYSLTARNPTSGAYGMAQFINGPGEYYQYGGNPFTAAGQLTAMFRYIRGRYGTPLAAAAHERAFNWYGGGFHGWVDKPTVIGVGERGRERVDITPGGGHGNTYNINVGVLPGNEREAGRWIVEKIRKFEQGSGASWRG